MGDAGPTTRLVVFSDDWGRHPSSCQHLISRLLPCHPTAWVNTIGTRSPGFSRDDLAKIARKLRQWTQPAQRGDALPANLTVITPRMYPGFRRPWQRRFNARAMVKAMGPWLRETSPSGPAETVGSGCHTASRKGAVCPSQTIGLTTLPITADLLTMRQALPVDRWIYYCVDDLAAWPGLDTGALQEMERQQVALADEVIAVSESLRERLRGMGAKEPHLLTHGIDLAHWASQQSTPQTSLPAWCHGLPRPIHLFWGLLDKRLDAAWCRVLRGFDGGTLVLAGPRQTLDEEMTRMLEKQDGVIAPGAVAFDALPALARWADVLVMPYADLPVTRAMQPLKFKEYLAADWPQGKPVVARKLPAVAEWSDAADLVETVDQLLAAVRSRVAQGLPESQRAARQRLHDESWEGKARVLEQIIVSLGDVTRMNTDKHR